MTVYSPEAKLQADEGEEAKTSFSAPIEPSGQLAVPGLTTSSRPFSQAENRALSTQNLILTGPPREQTFDGGIPAQKRKSVSKAEQKKIGHDAAIAAIAPTISAELRSNFGVPPDMKIWRDVEHIALFLADSNRITKRLIELDVRLQQRARANGGEPQTLIDYYQKMASKRVSGADKAKLEMPVGEVLIDEMSTIESWGIGQWNDSWRTEEKKIYDFLPIDEFIEIISSGPPPTDVKATKAHGALTHRLQWSLVYLEFAGSDVDLSVAYQYIGGTKKLLREPDGSQRGLWDAVVDRNGYDAPFVPFKSDIAKDRGLVYNVDCRSPELLNGFIKDGVRGKSFELLHSIWMWHETSRGAV